MHGVSHSCSWHLARCGWNSSRDSSGDSSGTACRLLFSRDRVQCLCAYPATQAWCQVTERDGSSELLFLSLCFWFSLFSHCKEFSPPAVMSRELQVRKQHERGYQTLLPSRHWQSAPAPRVLWRECVTLRASEQWEGNSQDGAGASPAICQG